MKNKYFFISFLVFISSTIWAHCIPLSPEMHVKKRYSASTPTFDIETDKKKVGTVYRKPCSWTTQYLLENENKEHIASAHIPSKYLYKVDDERGNLIGTIEEIPISSPTFEVFSSAGTRIAKAKLNVLQTKWKITDCEERHTLATLERYNFRNSMKWTLKIEDEDVFNENLFHPHLFLFLTAFQADTEHWQKIDELDPILKEELACDLETYAEHFEQQEPKETDFQFIENLTGVCLENQTLYDIMKCYFSFLESDQLTISQKAALYFMLRTYLT